MTSPENAARLLAGLGLNGAAVPAFRNRLINGAFSINQRAAPTAPNAYEPGTFLRDRWMAGPNGCTAACTTMNNGDTRIHIGSGSIVQMVDGGLYMPEGGYYCLSWQGTAIGRLIVEGRPRQFATSPLVGFDLAAGASVTVEFSLPSGASPVWVSLAQLEPGPNSTIFERRDDEDLRCYRYFRRLTEPPLRGVIQQPNLAARCGMQIWPPMRISPKINVNGALHIFDGKSFALITALVRNYGSSDCIDIDLNLSADLTMGRPAILFNTGAAGSLDLNAELSA